MSMGARSRTLPVHGKRSAMSTPSTSCKLPPEVASAFSKSAFISQMSRWARAFAAVRRFEISARAGRKFDYVGRLRFDTAIAAPLAPPLLLRQDRHYLAFPVSAKIRQRMYPLPDHFWFGPRAHAAVAFDILRRYQDCVSVEDAAGVAGESSSSKELCCGGGPTGLLVRALLNAEQRAMATAGHDTKFSGDVDARVHFIGNFSVFLLEHPILIVGTARRANETCLGSTNPSPVSVRGYFPNTQLCLDVIGSSC